MFSFFGSIDFNPINIKIVKIKSFKKNEKTPTSNQPKLKTKSFSSSSLGIGGVGERGFGHNYHRD